MAQTTLADVIVPEVFTLPTIELTAEKWEFVQSDIVRRANDIPIGRGMTIHLPFYQDLSGADNVWDDTQDITLNPITMDDDIAVVLTREKAWGATALSAALTGSSPTEAIRQLVANYWMRRYQACLIATVTGALDALSTSPSANNLDISGESGSLAYLDGTTFIAGAHELGDRSDELTTIAIHSAVEAWLLQNEQIEVIRDSQGALVMRTFQGRRVIVDDGMTVLSGGIYQSILFGAGAVTWVEEVVPNATEVFRHPEKKGGTDALYTRRKFVMHPRGIAWNPGSGVPAMQTPSNAELADGGNWDVVWETKNIKLVGIQHKIG